MPFQHDILFLFGCPQAFIPLNPRSSKTKGELEKFKGKDIELQFAVKSNGELEFYFIKFL